MKRNVGTIDRAIRLVFAVAVILLMATNVVTGSLAVGLGVLAMVMLATAGLGVCPLYIPAKISTRRDAADQPSQ